MPRIGIFVHFGPALAGSFGTLLVDWLVVVARGLYLARHLFTLFKFDCFLKGLQQLFLFYELVLIKNSNSVSIVPFSETYLRNASMSVALPIISPLHLGQMHGFKADLVICAMLRHSDPL